MERISRFGRQYLTTGDLSRQLTSVAATALVQSSTISCVRRMAACLAGVVLIASGMGGFVSKITMPAGTIYVYVATAICGVSIAWGVVLCLAARFPYALGIRVSLGTFCLSLSTITAAWVVDLFSQGSIFIPGLLLAALMAQAAHFCFSVGRRVRGHRERKQAHQSAANALH